MVSRQWREVYISKESTKTLLDSSSTKQREAKTFYSLSCWKRSRGIKRGRTFFLRLRFLSKQKKIRLFSFFPLDFPPPSLKFCLIFLPPLQRFEVAWSVGWEKISDNENEKHRSEKFMPEKKSSIVKLTRRESNRRPGKNLLSVCRCRRRLWAIWDKAKVWRWKRRIYRLNQLRWQRSFSIKKLCWLRIIDV